MNGKVVQRKKPPKKKTEKCWRNKKYKEQWFSFWKICTPKERVLFYLFKKKSDRLIHNNVYRPCSVLNEIKTKKKYAETRHKDTFSTWTIDSLHSMRSNIVHIDWMYNNYCWRCQRYVYVYIIHLYELLWAACALDYNKIFIS